ncbi:MAG: CDC27 family protein [Sulfurovaceae bacterium]
MHNVELLEKQWRRYQIKKYFPLVGGVLILLIMIFSFSILPDSKISNNSSYKAYDQENLPFFTHGAINVMEPIISDKNTIAIGEYKQNEQEFNTTTIEEAKNTKDVINSPVLATKNDFKTNLLPNNIPTHTNEYTRQKIKINLEQTTDINSITDVMRRFYESKDPNDSLFLAINYYEQNDYSKAFYWAIETNKITEDLEDSWIIMAKSKAKMGDRNEAMRILRAYATKKDSKKALSLMEQMETNQW